MPTPRKHESGAARAAAYRERKKEARLQEMQAKGLPPLPPLPTMPGTRRWVALRDRMRADAETMRDEIQSYYDERSESWQDSDKGAAFTEQLDRLETILEEIESLEN